MYILQNSGYQKMQVRSPPGKPQIISEGSKEDLEGQSVRFIYFLIAVKQQNLGPLSQGYQNL